MTNSADPDQLSSSGSTLFAKTRHDMFSKRRVKRCFNPDLKICMCFLQNFEFFFFLFFFIAFFNDFNFDFFYALIL